MKEDSRPTGFRQRRIAKFLALLEPGKTSRVLDVGGTFSYWKVLGLHNDPRLDVTIVNLGAEPKHDGNLHMLDGDACNLPFPDHSFDVVHSNSVIEHVGDFENMRAMASEARRAAPRHFIQTPNYWFPVEPHYKVPLAHWLPEKPRIAYLRALRKVPADRARQLKSVRSIHLIGKRQMQTLFPDSEIWSERVLGLAKSLVAIRQG
jgi:hypothetical protein